MSDRIVRMSAYGCTHNGITGVCGLFVELSDGAICHWDDYNRKWNRLPAIPKGGDDDPAK
jgi:hypothetical protein